MALEKADNSRIPTVSRVGADTLVELVYDSEKRATALAVSRFGGLWNIEQEVKLESGEIAVPYSATNNLIANECVLLPSAPAEYGLKDELVADIKAYLHRYVDLSPAFEDIAAYYVLLSWVHDAFGELPYLRLRGDYGTGKTRALMIIGSVCYRGFFASGASTVSPIFHTLDAFGGTLVLDEADLPYSDARAELVKILNNGTAKGMPVLRTVVNRHKEFNPYAFKVFGPKIVATRELFQDRALESRFLTEETGGKSLRPDIPIHLPPQAKSEALGLRNRLLHFRLCEFFSIKTDMSALMEGVEARLNQSTLSLLSLVDNAAVRARMQAHFLEINADMVQSRRERPEARILELVTAAFARPEATRVAVSDLTRRFNAERAETHAAISFRHAGEVVRRLGLITRKTSGVYVIPDTEKPKLAALTRLYGLDTERA